MTEPREQQQSPQDSVVSIVEPRVVRILVGILITGIGMAIVIAVGNTIVAGRLTLAMWAVVAAIPPLLGLLELAKRGYMRWATAGLVLLLYLIMIGVVLSRGTVRTPALSLLIIAAALSGLVLGRRGMITALVSGTLLAGGLALAEGGGLLRTFDPGPLFSYWLSISIFAAVTGMILSYSRDIAEDALTRAGQEITERRLAEQSLKASEARFRSLTGMSSDFYWETDCEHGLANRGLADEQSTKSVFQTGVQIGQRRWEIPSLSPDEAAWQAHRAVLDAHLPFRGFEFSRLGADGTERHVSISGDPVFDASGGFKGYRGVGTNITARKRAEEAVRAAEQLFRGLVEQSIAGIYIIQDEKLAYVNPRFAEIYGYASVDELIGRDPLDMVLEKDHDVVLAARRYVEAGNQSKAYGFSALRKDGTLIEIGVHSARATHNGRPAIIGLAQDISEKRRAEEQIQTYLKQLETAFMSTVEVATTLSELRDPYTAGHERRVGEIAVAIGAELGFDARRQEGLRVAGYLHDIGKITIPAEILSKPGKLSAIEFQLIQGHPQSSYDVLKDVEFPWPVAEVALQHHERMDGSGYPQGLKGEAIALEARIVAVADVIEAMSSHRPYRPGLGIDKALAEIGRGRGSAYDTEVADACLRLFRDGRYQLPA